MLKCLSKIILRASKIGIEPLSRNVTPIFLYIRYSTGENVYQLLVQFISTTIIDVTVDLARAIVRVRVRGLSGLTTHSWSGVTDITRVVSWFTAHNAISWLMVLQQWNVLPARSSWTSRRRIYSRSCTSSFNYYLVSVRFKISRNRS